MKKSILTMLLLATTISFSQTSKILGDFDEVNVFDRINVTLIPSSENRIEVNGDRNNEVEIINNNGDLKIRMALKKLLSGETIDVKLYFKKLEAIDASEGSSVICNEILKQTAIEITAKEGAEINLKLDVLKAKVKSVTGAKIGLSGQANNQEIAIGTGGILNAKDLSTTQTTVTITTGGEATVNATDLVDAKVRAGGSIIIYGKPKQINQKTVLGGTIEEFKR